MSKKRVAIGIITCRRPEGLRELLISLAKQKLSQQNSNNFSYYAVVVDNDLTGDNKIVVDAVKKETDLEIVFAQEPTPGIPAARNKSLEAAGNCDGFIFVDDDEKAPSGWLDALLTMWSEYQADVITGPVEPILPPQTPTWAKKSRLFVKNYGYRRGQVLSRAFTNNTLISKRVIQDIGITFDMRFQYTGSSDLHYFMRVRKKGYKIYWCPEAVIHETIPLSRINFKWVLKRGFRVGAGETKSVLYISPNYKTVLGVLYRAGGRTVYGFFQIILSPILKWTGLIFGSRRIASGIGSIAGLFGINYEEYRNIHK